MKACGFAGRRTPEGCVVPATEATSSLRSKQAKSAAARRWNRPDKDDLARDYAAAKLEDHIRRVVDLAPPLTAEQRDRLAGLLRVGAA